MSFSETKGYLTKPKPGVQINPLHPLSRGLVGYWLFNEGAGSLANDISGNKNHGQLANMSPNAQDSGWGGSKFGGGLKFDGVDDYVDCGSGSSSNVQDSNFSIEAGVNSNDGSSLQAIAGKLKFAPENWGLFQNGGKFWLQIRADGAGASAVANSAYSTGVWYHLVGIRRSNVIYLYVDGIEQTATSNFSDSPDTNADNVLIGRRISDNNYNFNGSIDSVRIYNRALSAEEVKQLYLDPFCNLLQVPIRRYSIAAPPGGAIMNQLQRANIGADLYNGVFA